MAHKGKATSAVDFNPEDPPPRRTAIPPSTAISPSIQRRPRRSMGRSTIRAPRISKETLSLGWEEARSMAGTGLATASSTRPLLPLSPRSEQATRARGRPYAHGRPVHSTPCRLCRLLLFYSSFIVSYIPLISIVTLGWNFVGRARRREEAENSVGGEDWRWSAEAGADVSVDAKSRREDGWTSATSAIPSSSSSWRHSCEYIYPQCRLVFSNGNDGVICIKGYSAC